MDARSLILDSKVHLQIIDSEMHQPQGRNVYAINHFSAQGFPTMWIAFALGAAIPREIHWTMTSAWTFPNRPFRKLLRWLSEKVLKLIAEVYDFTLMPPMPAEPGETQERAIAIRELFQLAMTNKDMSFAFAPEGRDYPGGVLGKTPPGFGRFIREFCRMGFRIQPAAIYEEDSNLILKFGNPFSLMDREGGSRQIEDDEISNQIMTAIARLLPSRLRGGYRIHEGE